MYFARGETFSVFYIELFVSWKLLGSIETSVILRQSIWFAAHCQYTFIIVKVGISQRVCAQKKEKKSIIFFLILELIIILIRLQVSLHAVSTFNLHMQRTQKTRLFHQPSHSPATHSPLSRITGSMSQEAPADLKPLLNPTQVYRDRIPSRCMCL